VMEYKASFMRAEAKYGGKIRLFEQELDKKFGLDKNTRKQKGVAQLANHIGHLFCKDPSERRTILELTDMIKQSDCRIERITPVLIVQEPALRLQILEDILSQKFRNLLNGKRISNAVRVEPLAVIDIDTLEEMKPHLIAGEFTLEQCLSARALRDPEYKVMWHDFLDFFCPNFQSTADTEVNRKFEEIMDRAKKNFFGES
jgi:hypothetical protein